MSEQPTTTKKVKTKKCACSDLSFIKEELGKVSNTISSIQSYGSRLTELEDVSSKNTAAINEIGTNVRTVMNAITGNESLGVEGIVHSSKHHRDRLVILERHMEASNKEKWIQRGIVMAISLVISSVPAIIAAIIFIVKIADSGALNK